MGVFEEVGGLVGKGAGIAVGASIAVYGGTVRWLFTDESWSEAVDNVLNEDEVYRIGDVGRAVGRFGGKVAKKVVVTAITDRDDGDCDAPDYDTSDYDC